MPLSRLFLQADSVSSAANPLSGVFVVTVHRLAEEVGEQASPGGAPEPADQSASPYTSTGFIVWYCFLFVCCGLPVCCCCVSYFCYRLRRNRPNGDDDLAAMFEAWERGQREREEMEIEMEISRIEANVNAFSMQEQKRRRECLLQSWGDCRMLVKEDSIVKVPMSKGDHDCDQSCPLDVETGQLKSMLRIPIAESPDEAKDEPRGKDCDRRFRNVPSNCAVCLGKYDIGEAIVWSSNPSCTHVFHEDCIVTWLMTRQNPLCPICRQKFTHEFSVDLTMPLAAVAPMTEPVAAVEGGDTGETIGNESAVEDDNEDDSWRSQESGELDVSEDQCDIILPLQTEETREGNALNDSLTDEPAAQSEERFSDDEADESTSVRRTEQDEETESRNIP